MSDPYASRLRVPQIWWTDGSVEPPTVPPDDPDAVRDAIRRATGRSEEEMVAWLARRGQKATAGRPRKDQAS